MPKRRNGRAHDRIESASDITADRLKAVGIGASAGGLDAAIRLMDALPPRLGMALILVQHLGPGHDSMMAELLARHTKMPVLEAIDGMRIEPDHLYVIPPGAYLAVDDGLLCLSAPPVRHGARLPFDFLLRSMAKTYGRQAACVILSGTGADGSIGLLSIKAEGGLVLAQDPTEAGFDGMPRTAIRTGHVDSVLMVADIPARLLAYRSSAGRPRTPYTPAVAEDAAESWLPRIVGLLRTETVHDFSRYKLGTLQRRVERRMALADIRPNDMERYFRRLESDADEREQLGRDLLINVTSFFRDGKVFLNLGETIIPDLVAAHAPDRPLRIWVAGCSTGEETYSLAILFLEQIAKTRRPIRLQVFASDIDADAVAAARDGFYPDTIEASVTQDRLRHFFAREDGGYRALPDLRAAIVFTVHDVLTDPPFSRLDLVSCRNLLIYLRPDAQAKVIALFHFALRQGGILLLGTAETVADADGRFETVAKPDRIYRRIGRNDSSRPGPAPRIEQERGAEGGRRLAVQGFGRLPARPAALAELGRRLVIETYAPASILINAANETLFSLGPTDRYLRLPPGHATHDLLAMARPGLRPRLRAAIQSARQTRAKVVMGGRITGDGQDGTFNLEVFPVPDAGEDMLLVCFVAVPQQDEKPGRALPERDVPRLAELERELEGSRAELQDALRDMELLNEEQKATNEEALSVNEEYQSTNEELLTSKEELQSLNEELTALNSQLQETLERQRTTSDDLQNVLYSTNVATLFLDRDLRIRFFTPATKSLFAIIATDVGRPLADLAALTPDTALEADARNVLDRLVPLEHEFETRQGIWFRRRVLPYRTQGEQVEGVVITFTDVTGRKHTADALEAAKQQAELANETKSRFLAAASHDLRQPLQTLALLQSLLAKSVEGNKAHNLVVRLHDTLDAMTSMLDTLLDINEIEAGAIRPILSTFHINELLARLRDEFIYAAEAKGLDLRIMPCSRAVVSDPRLLEQMIRNLLSNALKYTMQGRVLVGCRRGTGAFRVEVWDTGIGMSNADIGGIFEEYRQVGNAARERSQGLGLGLSIVKRLGELLGHRVQVRSNIGKGSHFSIEVPLAQAGDAVRASGTPHPVAASEPGRRGAVLVVEDDPDVRDLLEQTLLAHGHQVTTAPDGPAALACLVGYMPDLVLADYNLPHGLTGLELAVRLRRAAGWDLPAIILTGDISAETRHGVAQRGLTQLNKPATPADLMRTVEGLLAARPVVAPAPITAESAGRPIVFVVDDDEGVRSAIISILEEDGRAALGYSSGEAFLRAYRNGAEACLLVDAALPGMTGIDVLERLVQAGDHLPAIVITGHSDVRMAVRAMKAGASDFIEKPVGRADLLASIGRALEQASDSTKRTAWRTEAACQVAALTPRQRQIMDSVLAGQPSKIIAANLGISQRTVESHRASIMHKTGATSLPALARLALAAAPAEGADFSGLAPFVGVPA